MNRVRFLKCQNVSILKNANFCLFAYMGSFKEGFCFDTNVSGSTYTNFEMSNRVIIDLKIGRYFDSFKG